MTQIGTGDYRYEVVRDFFKSPDGEPFGLISRVAADAQDRIYVFQRRNPPVVVFDRDGKYLGAWGSGEVTDPHGLKIVGDTAYTTDRTDSVAKSFTLDGKPLLELGERGVHSDTGKLYVADRSNKRIQRFTPDGEYLGEWTGMGGPNDISRGKDGNFYIAEQEDAGNPAYVTVRDPRGNVLAKLASRHVHGVGVDSRGDIYAGLTQDRSVDKFVRVR